MVLVRWKRLWVLFLVYIFVKLNRKSFKPAGVSYRLMSSPQCAVWSLGLNVTLTLTKLTELRSSQTFPSFKEKERPLKQTGEEARK